MALHGDAAAVRAGDPAYVGQTHSQVRAGPFRRGERVEEGGDPLRRDAGALILYGEEGVPLVASDLELHGRAGLRGLDGVAREIEGRALEQVAIPADPEIGRCALHVDPDVRFLRVSL